MKPCPSQELRPTMFLADMKHVRPANEMKRVTEKTRDLLSSVDLLVPPTPIATHQAGRPKSRDHAAREYRGCRPPTRRIEMTSPWDGGSIARGVGELRCSDKCGRES